MGRTRGLPVWPVIPTGAERSEAKWRDLFCCCVDKRRSLDRAALRAASLGMTGNCKAKRLVPLLFKPGPSTAPASGRLRSG